MGFVFLTLLPFQIFPQNSRLQIGISQFVDGSYYRALEYFNQAISQDKSMTPEMLCEAYYYRGLTYVRIYNEVYAGEDEGDRELYKDALLFAYRDYKSGKSYDRGNYSLQIGLEMNNLHSPLLQQGLTLLNEYNNLVYNGRQEKELLALAEEYLQSALEIRETYLVCDLLGQVCLDKGMKQEAAEYFARSEKLYAEAPPDEPDFLMAYVYYRLAAIHKSQDARLALEDNQRGIEFLDREYKRFEASKSTYPAAKANEFEEQYKLALQDLINLKLDLYLTNQDLYLDALKVFEDELGMKPEDVNLLIGYASLLERSDKPKAIQTYRKALEFDEHNRIALFNLGALYYSHGKELFTKAQGTTDNEQFKLLMKEAVLDFETAKPYFDKALVEEPDSKETLEALKAIAFILDDQESYQKYQEMEKKGGK
jgi:tetratricopeptide (TPR) repeat protein